MTAKWVVKFEVGGCLEDKTKAHKFHHEDSANRAMHFVSKEVAELARLEWLKQIKFFDKTKNEWSFYDAHTIGKVSIDKNGWATFTNE
jgi:hypothetical protein